MNRAEDRKAIAEIPAERIPDFVFLHLRNTWSVDGLYFLGIEERFGTEAAVEIDAMVWGIMGKIEARRLKAFLGLGNDLGSMAKALRHGGWAMDLGDKQFVEEEGKVLVRNTACRVQKTRIDKGLGEFPCKQVRFGYLKAFAREFDPAIEVACKVCPPDSHADDLWCEWEFRPAS